MTFFVALTLAVGLAVPQTADPQTEAERLAISGQYEEALKRFQAIAAANPGDTTARVWIGRLHLRMGHPRRAAGVFESILATDGKNVEALTGLGVALVDLGDWDGAEETLKQAESLAPDRIDVLTAQGRLHGAAGRATLALAYYGRALAADPDNAEVRALSDALRSARAHRATVRYNFQRFDPSIGSMNAGSVAINARVNDAFRVVGFGEMLRWQDANEGRGGGGIEWLAHPRLLVRGGVFGGGETVLPSLDVFGEVTFHQRRAHWTVTTRVFDFEGANLLMIGPGLVYDVTPRLSLAAQYLRGRTDVDLATSLTTDNVVLGIHARPSSRSSIFAEYRHGIDRLDWMTADRIFADGADTFGFGGSLDVTPFVSLGGLYDHQDRETGSIDRARVTLTVRF